MNAAPVRRLQPVRSSTHAPRGMRPCSRSHASMRSTVSRKSGIRARRRRRRRSRTRARRTAAPGSCRTRCPADPCPVIQWIGASKCVPVCSPKRSVFQYHAGPLSSYVEMMSIVTPGEGAKIGGSSITGVDGPSGCVRSTTVTAPSASASTRSASTRFIRRALDSCRHSRVMRSLWGVGVRVRARLYTEAARAGLGASPHRSRTTSRPGHPGWLRGCSRKCSRHSRSSHRAIGAPCSAIWSSFSGERR